MGRTTQDEHSRATVQVSLAGRTALVTGGGSGIGRACATTLARAGAAVAVVDRDLAAARAAAGALAEEGLAAGAYEADVVDAAACERAVAAIRERFVTVDVLVNCAGCWRPYQRFATVAAGDWDDELAVNLAGTLTMTRAAIAHMSAQGAGAVVNVSSDAGRIGEFGLAAYSAAKAGVIAFSKALAREVGRDGVRVNCVAPGAVRTPATAPLLDQMDPDAIARAYPLGRVGTPEDIAGAVLFLASDLSAWVTGQVLSVNGGYSMVD